MTGIRADRLRCVVAVLLGVFAGGLLVAVAIRAVPKVLSGMMAGMMQNMMASAGPEGCEPVDI
jgi:hypothetical protein